MAGVSVFHKHSFGVFFSSKALELLMKRWKKYEIVERLLPLKMSSEHISVGCFGDGNSAEYFNFKTVAFVKGGGYEVLVAHL